MQCPNCQHWNEPGSRFCEECGFELTNVPETAAQVSVKTASPGTVPEASSTIPEPAPQNLVPADSPPPSSYTGPHMVLNSSGSIFKLGEATVVGREDASIQIDFDGYPDGKYISHRHAQIVRMNGKYYIEDLESSNHTW